MRVVGARDVDDQLANGAGRGQTRPTRSPRRSASRSSPARACASSVWSRHGQCGRAGRRRPGPACTRAAIASRVLQCSGGSAAWRCRKFTASAVCAGVYLPGSLGTSASGSPRTLLVREQCPAPGCRRKPWSPRAACSGCRAVRGLGRRSSQSRQALPRSERASSFAPCGPPVVATPSPRVIRPTQRCQLDAERKMNDRSLCQRSRNRTKSHGANRFWTLRPLLCGARPAPHLHARYL